MLKFGALIPRSGTLPRRVKAGTANPRIFAREMNTVTRIGQRCTSYAECVALIAPDPTADIDYDGVSGQLKFTGSGEPCEAEYSIVKYAAGKLVRYQIGKGTNLCTSLS